MNSNRIGMIGRIDPIGELMDGQTVKTRTVYQALVDNFGRKRIICVETRDYRKRFSVVIAQFVRCLIMCDDIIVSLSRNGRKVFFPLLHAASRCFGKRIYHNLIGGWLAQNLEEQPNMTRHLNAFEVNWVESIQLVETLSSKGIGNAAYLPNFKNLKPNGNPYEFHGPPYKVCTFSRVMREKGITAAIEAVEAINRDKGFEFLKLDIYGPVEDSYRSELRQLLNRNTSCTYCGTAAPEQSVDTIGRYCALLFPTEWLLEGMPGTILDALFAGVPIIASRWKYYDEMLEDGITGFGYDFGNQGLLGPTILKLFDSSIDVQQLHRNCLERSSRYSAPETFANMLAFINLRRESAGQPPLESI